MMFSGQVKTDNIDKLNCKKNENIDDNILNDNFASIL